MHPELTAQHTRLPSTSFSNMQPQLHYRLQTRGGILSFDSELPIKGSRIRYGLSAGLYVYLRLDLMRRLGLKRRWLIHCVMWTAGNGITFAEGREDNTVTPDNSLAMNRNRPCQAISASVFGRTPPPPTHSTNHSLPFPHIHQLRQLLPDKALACGMLHWFGRFLLIHSSFMLQTLSAPPPACFGSHAWPAVQPYGGRHRQWFPTDTVGLNFVSYFYILLTDFKWLI